MLEIAHDDPAFVIGPGPYSTVGDYVDIAGVQLEPGGTVTGFIPGGGVRDADSLSLDLSGSDFANGVWGVWRGSIKTVETNYPRLLDFSDATNSMRLTMDLGANSDRVRLYQFDGVSYQGVVEVITPIEDIEEIIFGVGPDFSQLIVNGAVSTVGAPVTFDGSAVERIHLGKSLVSPPEISLRTDEFKIISSAPTTELLQSEVTP